MRKFFTSAIFVLTFAIYGVAQYLGDSGPIKYVAVNTVPVTRLVHPVTPILPSPAPAVPLAPVVSKPKGQYVDGTYAGSVADAYYGNVEVQATVAGGKLADVAFLQYPNDRRHSLDLSNYAMPILQTEAIQAQSANVNTVSGASDTSAAFRQSLGDALVQARS